MELRERMKEQEEYAASCQGELRQLIRDLCAIPAPSHQEERRAVFCKNYLETAGGRGGWIDQAGNVICPWGPWEQGELVVVMAHMDTVFPDLEPMPFREEDGRFYCPGVCDDTAQLAVLLMCARYYLRSQIQPRRGVLFVANVCEEGLGDLKGSRAIVEQFGNRIQEFISLDCTSLDAMVNRAVGSHRYRITARTEGGHSFQAFGNQNAIHVLATLVETLYTVRPPKDGDSTTTYNVGTISGGTSVNTIAQEAEMLYEYRSDSRKCLLQMENMFAALIEAYRAMGHDLQVEKVGDRPCGGNVDPLRQEALEERAAASMGRVLGMEPRKGNGSTDCNAALAQGIPSICIGACRGSLVHTRGEYVELDSLEPACRYILDFLGETFRV